jgi:hypothetical protein
VSTANARGLDAFRSRAASPVEVCPIMTRYGEGAILQCSTACRFCRAGPLGGARCITGVG